jgi:hypothetical protein
MKEHILELYHYKACKLHHLSRTKWFKYHGGSVYIEALPREKFCVIADPEYGALEGHTLIIKKLSMD